MTKKNIIVLLLSTFLLCVAGCGKLNDANVSNIINEENNLKKCQMLCDKEATMYPGLAAQVKKSCYSNCNEIEALNKRTENNTTTTRNTQEEIQIDDDEGMVNDEEDCKKLCRLGLLTTATTQEIDDCEESCKVEVLIQSDDIRDCDNINELSKEGVSKDVCITQKAIDNNKPEWCGMVSEDEQKDSCFFYIAGLRKDRAYCSNIKNSDTQEYCQTMPFGEE